MQKRKKTPIDFIKQFIRIKKRLPVLPYIETHLVDHCNLKCIGCTHFSHLSEEKLINIEDFEKDMTQLSKILRFKRIRLLGGEPLLHPDINKFMTITRKYFPRTNIFIVTNGLLLNKMGEDFWQTCKENNIGINLSKYPPNKSIIKDLKKLITSHGVNAGWIHPGEKMYVFHNPLGNSNRKKAFKYCAIKYYRVIVLKNSRIYTCPKTAFIDIFNKKFNKNLPQDQGKNIYTTSAKTIIKYLKQPIPLCKYCAYRGRMVPWESSQGKEDEWYVLKDLKLIDKFIKYMDNMIEKQKKSS